MDAGASRDSRRSRSIFAACASSASAWSRQTRRACSAKRTRATVVEHVCAVVDRLVRADDLRARDRVAAMASRDGATVASVARASGCARCERSGGVQYSLPGPARRRAPRARPARGVRCD